MDAVPAVGEHSEKILTELGLDSKSIQELKDAKAI
jgi:crotonobetainyl-CoA:carnitine CoA-transferase CaiB-like acyl-CoA transferase